MKIIHTADSKKIALVIGKCQICWSNHAHAQNQPKPVACLHGDGGPQVGEVTRLGRVILLSI